MPVRASENDIRMAQCTMKFDSLYRSIYSLFRRQYADGTLSDDLELLSQEYIAQTRFEEIIRK